jgi:hypothetical protein
VAPEAGSDMVEVRILPFSSLLEREALRDLVHSTSRAMNLQSAQPISSNCRSGWAISSSARFVYDGGREKLEDMTSPGGTQVWRNPRL